MYSAFSDPFRNPSVVKSELAEILREKGVSHVYIVGLAMDYCVRYTAIDAVREGFETFVFREGTKAVDPGDGGWGETEREFGRVGVKLVGVEGAEVERVKRLGDGG